MDTPTSVSTKDEIKTYLDAQGIEYKATATKEELLALIPPDEAVQEEKTGIEDEVTTKEPEETLQRVLRYTKNQLIYMSSFSGATKDLMSLALKQGVLYTLEEALAEVDAFSERLWW